MSFPPENLCLSTLAETPGATGYCPAAIRDLWRGQNVSPVLSFSKPEAREFQREHARRISRS